MSSKNAFSNAINSVIKTVIKQKKAEKIDMQLFANNCINEFVSLDLPFYSIEPDKIDSNRLTIETPFVKSCKIQIEPYKFGSSDKMAVLYVNNNPVRKIKIEDKNPEYMKKVAHGLLDYLNRFMLLKNKFVSY